MKSRKKEGKKDDVIHTKNALSRRKMPFGNPTEYQWVTKSTQTGQQSY